MAIAPQRTNIMERAAVPMRIQHIPSLDGLRAVSFLLVFFAHAGLERWVPGGLGVTIFFFLSGFLITTLMRAEFASKATINFRNFWLRRMLRIFPPFYLILAVTTLAALIFDPPGTLSAAGLMALALHYTNYWTIAHGYAGIPAGTGVYWSLAVEEHFYLLFPWFFFGMQKLKLSARDQASMIWILCALLLLWRVILTVGFHVAEDRTYMASDTRIDSILFGCALAVWKNPVMDDVVMRERLWKYAYVPFAVLLFGLCLVVRDAIFRETLRYTLQGVGCSILFTAAIRFHGWTVFRLLNSRVLIFVGLLSYSLYLLHFGVIVAVQRNFAGTPPWLQGVLALTISIALSWIIHVLIERPCATLRKKLSS